MRTTTTIKAAITVAVLGIAAFVVSGIPRFKNAKHGGNYVVGETVWLIFLACVLALVVLGVTTVVRLARHRRTAYRPR